MNLTDIEQFLTEDDAVSPVIGVILMVAITVILAAVIGTFVLGLGQNVQASPPNANFQFAYSGTWDDTTDGTTDSVKITHNGGQDVKASELTIQVGSADAITDVTTGLTQTWPATVSTGSTLEVQDGDLTNADTDMTGQTVRVVWSAPGGGSSNTIGSSQIPA